MGICKFLGGGKKGRFLSGGWLEGKIREIREKTGGSG